MPETALGDVVAIPVEGKYFACKIIWISKRTKDVIGLVAVGEPAASVEELSVEANSYREFMVVGKPATVFYGDKKTSPNGVFGRRLDICQCPPQMMI